MQLLRILFYCTFTILSCKSNKPPEELKAAFYQNKIKLDEFVNILKADKILDSILSNRTKEQGWTFNDLQKTYPKVYELLSTVGITVHLHTKIVQTKEISGISLKLIGPMSIQYI